MRLRMGRYKVIYNLKHLHAVTEALVEPQSLASYVSQQEYLDMKFSISCKTDAMIPGRSYFSRRQAVL